MGLVSSFIMYSCVTDTLLSAAANKYQASKWSYTFGLASVESKCGVSTTFYRCGALTSLSKTWSPLSKSGITTKTLKVEQKKATVLYTMRSLNGKNDVWDGGSRLCVN